MRDFQRSKVYDSESRLDFYGKYRIDDIHALRKYVSDVSVDSEFGKRYPCYYNSIRVKDGRHCRMATGSPAGYINMPRWSRSKLVILHEIAHVVSPCEEVHGERFCGNFLWLVHKFMGEQYYLDLRGSFMAVGVKFIDPITDTINVKQQTIDILRAKTNRRKEILTA